MPFSAHVREITQRSPVLLVLHLDHGASVEHVLRAIRCGFTSVMIDGSLLPYEEKRGADRRSGSPAHAVLACRLRVNWEPSDKQERR